ncbi:MAG: hypothetical protein IR160_06295 [Salinibacterium sp.]|nr:hypothetical protein [Salinibacterium sp.]MBF0672177.1 hypothetical protein [Salinibacterium sp.]
MDLIKERSARRMMFGQRMTRVSLSAEGSIRDHDRRGKRQHGRQVGDREPVDVDGLDRP